MHRVDEKFARWTAIEALLNDAMKRLHEAMKIEGPVPPELLAEIARLQQECRVALDELNAEYARVKGELGPGHPGAGRPPGTDGL